MGDRETDIGDPTAMSDTLNRAAIHALLTQMAELLAGEPQASGWRASLVKAADIAQDPTLEDDQDTITEIGIALRDYYRRNARVISDVVINRPDRDEMLAVNRRFASLQEELFRGLPG